MCPTLRKTDTILRNGDCDAGEIALLRRNYADRKKRTDSERGVGLFRCSLPESSNGTGQTALRGIRGCEKLRTGRKCFVVIPSGANSYPRRIRALSSGSCAFRSDFGGSDFPCFRPNRRVCGLSSIDSFTSVFCSVGVCGFLVGSDNGAGASIPGDQRGRCRTCFCRKMR